MKIIKPVCLLAISLGVLTYSAASATNLYQKKDTTAKVRGTTIKKIQKSPFQIPLGTLGSWAKI